jgi:PhnB protein
MTIRPDRYRNAIFPHIYVDAASDGIAFHKRAFGTVELFCMARPNGKIWFRNVRLARGVSRAADRRLE